MERLHAPNEFFRIRRLREGIRAWEELWRSPADGPAPAREPGGFVGHSRTPLLSPGTDEQDGRSRNARRWLICLLYAAYVRWPAERSLPA